MVGFAENYFTAFALFCKLTSNQIAMLLSIPQFLSNFLQLFSSFLFGNSLLRKTIVMYGVFIQAIVLIILSFSTLIFKSLSFSIILVFFIFYFLSGNITGPLWNSMMGDIVDENERGIYFGRRNRKCQIVLIFSILIAGYFLSFFKKLNIEYAGFIIIIFIAGFARLFSVKYLNLMIDPIIENEKIKIKNKYFQIIKELIKNPENIDFFNFAFFLAFLNFSIYVASPFFYVYVLKDLKFNYIQFTIVTMIIIVIQLLTMSKWGKLGDRYGNKFFIILSSIGIIIAPLLWVFSGNFYWILFIQIYAGFFWAGFSLLSSNYIFDSLKNHYRAIGFSLVQFFNGIGILSGAYVGGKIATYLETNNLVFIKLIFSGYYFRFLFFLSFFLRLIVFLIFFKKFNELRIKSAFSDSFNSTLKIIKIRNIF
ncbi:MAG TPA: MFS transporter [bacterium]|nr:MFS transporter [bacterium]HOL46715.1 MFS transporter [bacterium]HPQ18151.1 MFS transporter [bacterium]